MKEETGHDPGSAPVPASDITVPRQFPTPAAARSRWHRARRLYPNAWGAAPADLTTIAGFRIVMNRDIEPGEKIRFVA